MDIKCTFQNYLWPAAGDRLEYVYTCVIKAEEVIKLQYKSVESFKGRHFWGCDNLNVKAVRFEDCHLKYFPRGLAKVFPNITHLAIIRCGLEEVSRRDLSGLENLTHFMISDNPLTSLPNDLFEDFNKLQVVSFHRNNIQTASSKIIQSILKNPLIFIDLTMNSRINVLYAASNQGRLNNPFYVYSIQQLMDKIDEKCFVPKEVDQVRTAADGLKDFWETGQLSDLVIKTKSKEFQVQKVNIFLHSEKLFDIIENEDEITLPYPSEVVEEFLKYCYLNEAPSSENVVGVFKMAMKYEAEALSSLCLKIIEQNLNAENAYDVYHLSYSYKLLDLMKIAFTEIKIAHYDIFIAEDMINKPMKLKEIISWRTNLIS